MDNPVERRALYAVIEREGLKKGIWAPIGSAFRNRDGLGRHPKPANGRRLKTGQRGMSTGR
jgi:hypothetical protein